ncbi:hypothetical protein ACE1CI_06020 [Aerosakkonemataceae cyanobacterium BLCC-F50]|uniref:Uncharacterized protein n=1 Tax=Floridaenema flaviceps BLCC-F50 TaxID=3153642 RepID=A0ABV4XLB8_9CYAN
MKKFSISVYFFHLNQTIAESLDRVSPQADLIWENLIKLSEKLPFPELTNLKSQLLCYELDKESNVFKHKKDLNSINFSLIKDKDSIKLIAINQNGLTISGNLQAFLLHDTYAFDLSLYPENKQYNITAEELHLFQPSSLFLDCSENTLGETIWLIGETEIVDKGCKDLADEFVKEFLKDTKFTGRLVAEGKLLKVPLLEYEISNQNQPNKRYKILFWIDNKAINPKEIERFYDDLMLSLWTRHKIEYVYEQARDSYREARKVYSELEAKIKEFKQDKPLEELQKLLESMPELSMQYQRQLRNLQAHCTTIKVNQINYQNYLQKFWQPGDISTWQEFGETTCKRYLNQIETYLSYIQPGKDLIGEFINTLRGLVEIEQVKSDRNLQIVLAVVGVGIGFAGIAATALPYLIEAKPNEKLTIIPVHFQPSFGINPPHNFTLSVLFSLGAGVVGVAIAARAIGYIQKHPKSPLARIVNFILGNSQSQ